MSQSYILFIGDGDKTDPRAFTESYFEQRGSRKTSFFFNSRNQKQHRKVHVELKHV